MSLEGHLNIVLPRDPSADARIDLKEPADITRLLAGRPPDTASQLVPMLFSLCGTAHAVAAISAVETAQGIQVASETLRLRNCFVLMERAREHILRISLAWPELMGLPPDTETAQAALKLLPAFHKAIDPEGQAFSGTVCIWPDSSDGDTLIACLISLTENRILGETVSSWSDRQDWNAISAWANQSATSAARFLSAVPDRSLDDMLHITPLFLSESSLVDPTEIDELVPETSSFDRHRNHPLFRSRLPSLANRYLARLVDLTETIRDLQQLFLGNSIPSLPVAITDTPGVCTVETARGRLTHVVDLCCDRVANYKIISPTRWNFASRGVATRYLDAIPPGPDSMRIKLADLVVGAIDPCVAYDVRIH